MLSTTGPNVATDVEQYLHRQHGAGSCRIFAVGSEGCDVQLKIKVRELLKTGAVPLI